MRRRLVVFDWLGPGSETLLDIVEETVGVSVEDPGGALEGLEAAVGLVLEVVAHPGDLVGCVVVCEMLVKELSVAVCGREVWENE